MGCNPPESWTSSVCSLIEHVFPNKKTELSIWSQWTLFTPKDIPRQGNVLGTKNNCGGHVCTWIYVLYSGENINFDESHMNEIRAWIMSTILGATKLDTRNNQKCNAETQKGLRPVLINNIKKTNNHPPGFGSTMQYCLTLKVILSAEKV